MFLKILTYGHWYSKLMDKIRPPSSIGQTLQQHRWIVLEVNPIIQNIKKNFREVN